MEQQLLFFDTFSHENTEDLNLDLVQFPCPVLITGLRVIPLGTRVQVDLPRGERLGATNPSSFKLEFFVNNLSKVGASTFEKLGFLEYKQNVDIEVLPQEKVATDGLILKGWYTTLTLAVYGCETTVAREVASPPPPPPPQPRSQVVCSSSPAEGLLPVPDFTKPPPNTFIHTTPEFTAPHQPEYVRCHQMDYTPIKSEFIQPDFSRPPPIPYDNSAGLQKQDPILGLASPPQSPLERNNSGVKVEGEERRQSDGDPRDIPLDHRSTGDARPRDPRDKDEHEMKTTGHWAPGRGEYHERHNEKRPRSPPPSSGHNPEGPRSPLERQNNESRNDTGNEAQKTGMYESGGCHEDAVDEMYSVLSDSEMQEGDGYSDISSDEDNLLSRFDDGDMQERMGEWDVESDYPWSFATSSFNPCQCDFVPLETFSDPSLTDFEKEKPMSEQPEAATQILQIVNTYKEAEHGDKWVEALEGLPALLVPGFVYLQNCKEHADVLDVLIDWTLDGLNLEKAIAQPVTAFKVRHLKMGIQLCGALCRCDENIAQKLLVKDVQHRLFDLYESQYMSSSVKLHIVNALDATTRFSAGLQWLLGMHPLQVNNGVVTEKKSPPPPAAEEEDAETKADTMPSEQVESVHKSGYQRLISILINKERVRCVTTLAAFLNKVHIYEVLVKLEQTVNELSDYHLTTEQMKSSQGTDSETDTPLETDIEMSAVTETVSDGDLEMITNCLQEVAKVIVNADHQIAQPQRTLPNRVQFAIKKRPHNPYPNLFHMFNSCHLLECVFAIFSSPVTSGLPTVFCAARDVILNLLATQDGLLYLSSRPDTTNGIVRALTQNITDYANQEESREDTASQQLGLKTIYSVQTIQFLDQLKDYHAKDPAGKSVDDAEVLGVLHSLYSMTTSMHARDAVAHVLSLNDNMHVFLPFVELSGEAEKDDALQHSVCHNYTLMILLIVLRHSEHVQWLDEKFVTKLVAFTESERAVPSPSSSKVTERMAEIREWLQPVCQPGGGAGGSERAPLCSLEALPNLITLLKQYADDLQDPPPRCLATVLRLIRQLAVPPEQKTAVQNDIVELKYKYVLMELFSADCLVVFTGILQKLSDMMLLPWQQGIPLHRPKSTVIIAIVKCILAIIKPIFCILIEARGEQFKDLSALPCLINLHTVMCSVSTNGSLNSQLQQIQNDIIDILLTFTQPLVSTEESEEAYAGSLWTQMVKTVLQQLFTAPYMFLSCLVILSELLPLPIPIQTRDPLSPAEVIKAVNSRKLWSTHLLPLTSLVQDVIKQLAMSSNASLQQLLKRVCCQMADLAAPAALMVVRSLLDCLLDSMDVSIDATEQSTASTTVPPVPTVVMTTTTKDTGEEEKTATGDEKKTREEVKSSAETARILKLIAFLINHAAIKTAFLHLCRTSGNKKTDEKYADVIPRMVRLLNVVNDDKVSHIKAQEAIVMTIQSLCDIEVTLISHDSDMPYLAQLANSVPSGSQLQLLCAGLLEHIDQRDHSYSSILPALRTLTILTEHDYGFYHTKSGLEKVPTALYNLFFRIDSTFSKDSSDCIATLSSAIECIQFLVTLPDGNSGGGSDERTFTLSSAEMRGLLRWSRDLETHPLDDLDKLLQVYAKDEETLKAIYDSVNSVLSILNAEDDRPGTEVTEPVLPPVESPSSQFSQRAVYIVTESEEDDRLHAAYWLSTVPGDDSDQECEMETCDLEAMSKKYCAEFDLQAELSKDSLAPETTANKPRRRLRVARHAQNTINTSRMRGNTRNFAAIAPMRGRGFNRGNMNQNRSDPFRSRTPNTSRPPSMHVDDFVKMESETPANVAGGGNAPRRMTKDSGRGRGGDRGRGFSARGRFFSPPGNYNRRDGGFARGGSYNARNVRTASGNAPLLSTPSTHGGNSNIHGVNSGNRMGVFGRNTAGIPTKSAQGSWMGNRTVRQSYGSGFGHNVLSDGRQPGIERADRRRDDATGSLRFGHGAGGGGGGGGYWASGKSNDDRFTSTGNQGFYGRRDRGRHQRAFTK